MKNKRLYLLMIVAIVALSACFAACDNSTANPTPDNDPVPVEYTVTFDSAGGTEVTAQKIKEGDTATEPAAPTRNGYTFGGWYNGDAKYVFTAAVTGDITLTAHWSENEVPPPAVFTVTFDSDGGSNVPAQSVTDGLTATKPTNPEKSGYVFSGWYNGDSEYDFTAAVTGDITLTAHWEDEPPAVFTVTFDSDGGTEIDSASVTDGEKVTKPDSPTRSGYYFDGWFNGSTKYDFSGAVTDNITLTANWVNAAETDAAFTAALAADYGNFTSASTATDESGSLTDIFKQADKVAYWDPDDATTIFEEHLVVFGNDGHMLAMYYKHDDEWKKSGLVSYADFVIALYLNEISLDDVTYSEGAYRVYDDSVSSVVYALFRSTDSYNDFSITVEDGRISSVFGTLSDGTEHVQTFYDFGTTSITIPSSLPAVTVEIAKKDKEVEAGRAIDKAELIDFLFAVKVEDKAYSVTEDMIDFGELDFDDPQAGTYTVTISFDTFDGVTHTETATVTVTAPQSDETFAQIMAKDYSNFTFGGSGGAVSGKFANGVYSIPNAFLYIESDGSLTKYHATSFGETKNTWSAVPRLDMLFALDADLFEQTDDTNVYEVKNNEIIVDILGKTTATTSTIVNTKRDYSIKLTVEVGRITKIELNYYALAKTTSPTTSNGTSRTLTYTLSDFGTTEFDIPAEIEAKRPAATAALADYITDKRYSA